MKSFAAGIVMFLLTVVLSYVCSFAFIHFIILPARLNSVGGDTYFTAVTVTSNWVNTSDLVALAAGVIAFAGGFIWTFRRASKRV